MIKAIKLSISAALVALLAGCAMSPTGHRQLALYSPVQMAQMGATAYDQQRQSEPLATNAHTIAYVQCVAQAITSAMDSSRQWRVSVFKTDKVNAWALPGGYIGVYTGLLKYAQTPAQLAAVLGHEVTHVIADHSNARMSLATLAQNGLQVLNTLTQGRGEQYQLAMAALGVGTKLGVLLPYSRHQESEADTVGLSLMARAGFDPKAAITLWHNMAQAGATPPEFLSDHPSNADRIENLKAHMPEALSLYRAAQAAGRHPQCAPPAS